MASLKRQRVQQKHENLKNKTKQLVEQSEERKKEYYAKVGPLKEVKQKYFSELSKIEGVKAVGLKVYEEKIAVYCNRNITKNNFNKIPKELDGFKTKIIMLNNNSQVQPETVSPDTTNYIDTPVEYYNFFKKPKLSASTSIGHVDVALSPPGTLGSFWYSKTYGKIVGTSCNHVYASVNRAKTPRTVISTDFNFSLSLIDGGVAYTGTIMADDKGKWNGTDIEYKKASTITSISSTTFKIGDIVTITGDCLGTRKGYSKIYFNDIEAQVKSWTFTGTEFTADNQKTIYRYTSVVTTIQAIVPPNISVGPVVIRINVEGDPIVSPGIKDNGTLANNTVGYLQHFFPLHSSNQSGDVGFFAPYDQNVNNIETRIFYRIGVNDTAIMNTKEDNGNIFPFDQNKYYQPLGFAGLNDVIEGTALIKTGRTNGTTVFVIYDASWSATIPYGDGVQIEDNANPGGYTNTAVFPDVLYYHGYMLPNGQPTWFDQNISTNYAGDSGASLFTATPEQYNTWFDFWVNKGEIAYPTIKPVFSKPFLFVGNHFAKYYGQGWPLNGTTSGTCDKYAHWGPDAGMGLQIVQYYLSADGTTFSEGSFKFYFGWDIKGSAASSSSGSFKIMQLEYVNVKPIMLTQYQKSVSPYNFGLKQLAFACDEAFINNVLPANDLQLSTIYEPIILSEIDSNADIFAGMTKLNYEGIATVQIITDSDYNTPFVWEGSSIATIDFISDIKTYPQVNDFILAAYSTNGNNLTINFPLQLVSKNNFNMLGISTINILQSSEQWTPFTYNGDVIIEGLTNVQLGQAAGLVGNVIAKIIPEHNKVYSKFTMKINGGKSKSTGRFFGSIIRPEGWKLMLIDEIFLTGTMGKIISILGTQEKEVEVKGKQDLEITIKGSI